MTNFIQDPIIKGFEIAEKEKKEAIVVSGELKMSPKLKTTSSNSLVPIILFAAIGGMFLMKK